MGLINQMQMNAVACPAHTTKPGMRGAVDAHVNPKPFKHCSRPVMDSMNNLTHNPNALCLLIRVWLSAMASRASMGSGPASPPTTFDGAAAQGVHS